MGVKELVQEQYPSLSFLLKDPEIGPLLTKAVDPNTGFSPQTFQAKLYQTNWWKRQSNAQREWLIKSYTDPGSAKSERQQYSAELGNMAKQMGVSLTNAQLKWITESNLASGIAPDSAATRNALSRLVSFADRGQGNIGAAGAQIRAIAEGKYYSKVSANRALKWSKGIVAGTVTVEAIENFYRTQATKRFPHLRDELAAGMSLADVIEPMRELVANELELRPSQIDVVGTPTWRKLTGIRDPKSGKTRLPTESEVIKLARERPEWWKTSKGREADHGMATTLMNTFGNRKSLGG